MNRILIVEDESIIALNIEHSLARLGYDVVGMASSSTEAVEMANDRHPDIVLMDINLGSGGDGIDTAERIRSGRNTAVIYLTAYSEDATLKRAGATRPYGYLIKPFSERELHATIQMAIERHRFDLAIVDAEERLRLALEVAEMGIWEIDTDSGKVQTQASTNRLLGLEDEAFGGTCAELLECVVPEDRGIIRQAYDNAVMQGDAVAVDFRGLRADGTQPWLRVRARRYGDSGPGQRLIGVAQDITLQRQRGAALRQAAVVFNASREAIFIADEQLRLVAVNAAFCDVTGHEAAAVIGRPIGSWLLRPAATMRSVSFHDELREKGHWQGELLGLRRAGEGFPVWLNITSVPDERGGPMQAVGIFSDIGALRRAEEKLLHLAHYDPLTGLPNRLLAMDRLNHAISRARRHKWRAAVLMIDLDNFKHVNDTLGHAAGDEVLRIMSSRLRPGLRDEDTVARLGGDEFIVILDRVAHVEDIAVIAGKIMQRLSAPLTLQGREIRSGASLGVSIFPDDAQGRDSLLRAADTAMYVAKDEGRNRVAYFAREMTEKLAQFVAAEQDLRRGVAKGELRVHYQPQVSLADMRLTGLEALVRWQHPTRGLLGAGEVVPIAEASTLIVEVGTYVIHDVCRTIRRWLDAGLDCPRVAVNVSVQQLREAGFAQLVASAMAQARIGADHLEIELTESTLQQESICLPAMQALAALGVPLAIDDFGTGYSSLASLKRLPVARCKIDRAFVSGIAPGTGDAAIAGAIIDLGHRLNMRITAEGVETEDQLDTLKQLGCDDAQGFLFDRALPPEGVESLLRTGRAGAYAQPASGTARTWNG